MKRQQFHSNLHIILLLLIAFFLPIARFVPLFIGLLLLNWIVEGDFKQKFDSIRKSGFAWIFILFYSLHVIGLAYTDNMDSGLFDIQVKLSLLVFPLILCGRPLAVADRYKIFYALIAGGICSSVILLVRAIWIYQATGENNFFYEAFSAVLIHPGYLSMYLNFAIAWILMNLLRPKGNIPYFSFIPALAVILFFSFIIVLLSSKLGLITMALIYFGSLTYYVFSRQRYLIGIAGIFLIALTGFCVMKFMPDTAARVNNAIAAITAPSTDSKDAESTAVRMLIWKAANEVISKNVITGVGTGDAKDALMKEYEVRDMEGALEHKLNAHNEFYQVFVALGLIGFLLLCFHLFYPIIYYSKRGNRIYLVFLVIIILNFLIESMLEAQAGVIFFAFFNSLLCFQKTTDKIVRS